MPNKQYVRGYNFEQRVKKHLEDFGYFVVRAGGSHGIADLVAIAPPNIRPKILFIQCKISKGLLSKTERTKMLEECKRLDNVYPKLAYRKGRRLFLDDIN